MRIFTDNLHYFKEDNLFTCEASDLGGTSTPLFHRIYPDACDEGVVLISSKTGKEATFYLDETVEDDEGDLLCWKLLPDDKSILQNPKLRGCILTIFND